MEIKIDLSNVEIEVLKQRQVLRMNLIQVGMDEKEPLDFVIQKIMDAVEKENTHGHGN